MEEKIIITRQEATKEVLDEIYRVIRKVATKLPPEKAKKLFYTEEELKERKKRIWKELNGEKYCYWLLC